MINNEKKFDVFKMDHDNDNIYLVLGVYKGTEPLVGKEIEENEVDVVYKIPFKAEMLKLIIRSLIAAGINYQNETGKDIGFAVDDKGNLKL